MATIPESIQALKDSAAAHKTARNQARAARAEAAQLIARCEAVMEAVEDLGPGTAIDTITRVQALIADASKQAVALKRKGRKPDQTLNPAPPP